MNSTGLPAGGQERIELRGGLMDDRTTTPTPPAGDDTAADTSGSVPADDTGAGADDEERVPAEGKPSEPAMGEPAGKEGEEEEGGAAGDSDMTKETEGEKPGE